MVFTVYCLYCNVSGLVVLLLNKFEQKRTDWIVISCETGIHWLTVHKIIYGDLSSTVSNNVAHSSCLKPIASPDWLAASSCCKRYSLTSYGLPSNHHSTRRTIGFMHQLITRSDTLILAICRHVGYGVRCRVTSGYDWTDICQPWGEDERPVLLRCLAVSADASSNQTCRRTLFIHKQYVACGEFFVLCDFPR